MIEKFIILVEPIARGGVLVAAYQGVVPKYSVVCDESASTPDDVRRAVDAIAGLMLRPAAPAPAPEVAEPDTFPGDLVDDEQVSP